MASVPGVADLSLEQQMDVPFVRFVLNRPTIARYGLRPGDVAEAIETSFAGATVGRIFDSGTAFDLIVKFDPSASADFERVADLPVDTPTGGSVPVRLLADVRREQGPNMVLRENVQRRIVISCNVAGRDLGSVVEDIRSAVAQVGADAGRLPRRVRRPVRERAERVAAAAGARRAGPRRRCSCCSCWRSAGRAMRCSSW